MSWPFESTSEDRKRERKAGYDQGLKGNDVKTNWSGREYYKGARAGYEKYKENQRQKNKFSSSRKTSKERRPSKNSSSGGGGYSGGGGGGDVNWPLVIFIIVIIIIALNVIMRIVDPPLSEKERQQIYANQQEEIRIEKERRHEFKTSLPAGLTPESKNYIEIFNQSGTIYIPYGHIKPPNATYHLYDRYLNDGKNRWEEIPIKTIIQQQKPSNEWRLIIDTKYFRPFGQASRNQRTIISWDLKQDNPQEIEEDDPWAITDDDSQANTKDDPWLITEDY